MVIVRKWRVLALMLACGVIGGAIGRAVGPHRNLEADTAARKLEHEAETCLLDVSERGTSFAGSKACVALGALAANYENAKGELVLEDAESASPARITRRISAERKAWAARAITCEGAGTKPW